MKSSSAGCIPNLRASTFPPPKNSPMMMRSDDESSRKHRDRQDHLRGILRRILRNVLIPHQVRCVVHLLDELGCLGAVLALWYHGDESTGAANCRPFQLLKLPEPLDSHLRRRVLENRQQQFRTADLVLRLRSLSAPIERCDLPGYEARSASARSVRAGIGRSRPPWPSRAGSPPGAAEACSTTAAACWRSAGWFRARHWAVLKTSAGNCRSGPASQRPDPGIAWRRKRPSGRGTARRLP